MRVLQLLRLVVLNRILVVVIGHQHVVIVMMVDLVQGVILVMNGRGLAVDPFEGLLFHG